MQLLWEINEWKIVNYKDLKHDPEVLNCVSDLTQFLLRIIRRSSGDASFFNFYFKKRRKKTIFRETHFIQYMSKKLESLRSKCFNRGYKRSGNKRDVHYTSSSGSRKALYHAKCQRLYASSLAWLHRKVNLMFFRPRILTDRRKNCVILSLKLIERCLLQEVISPC